VIELYEVEKAYEDNGASNELKKLLEKYALLKKPCSNDEIIERFDVFKCIKRRESGAFDGSGVITPEMFEKWIIGQITTFNRNGK